MLRRLTLGLVAGGLTTLVAACGASPSATPQTGGAQAGQSGTRAPSSSTKGSPKGAAQTQAAPDGSGVQAGTNHNAAASAYAKKASDVQAWLKDGTKAANYPDHKIAFLTFDDGPNTSITPKDLDELKKAGVHATFYYITKQLGPSTTPIAQRTIAEGNSVDAHTWSHNYNTLYPGRSGNTDHIVADYDHAEQALKQTFGNGFQNHGIRYPGGHMSWKNLAPADQALATKGLYWIDWNTMTGDAEPPKTHPTTADGMVQMVFTGISEDATKNPNVAVILMHDAEDKKLTNQALPGLIARLKSEGYEFDVID